MKSGETSYTKDDEPNRTNLNFGKNKQNLLDTLTHIPRMSGVWFTKDQSEFIKVISINKKNKNTKKKNKTYLLY